MILKLTEEGVSFRPVTTDVLLLCFDFENIVTSSPNTEVLELGTYDQPYHKIENYIL